jgi:hypothetical protein
LVVELEIFYVKKSIRAIGAAQGVTGRRITGKDVIGSFSSEHGSVFAGTAVELIIATLSGQRVIATHALKLVCCSITDQNVVKIAPNYILNPRESVISNSGSIPSSRGCGDARCEVHRYASGGTRVPNGINAYPANIRVVTGTATADNQVIAIVAVNNIIASATVQNVVTQ